MEVETAVAEEAEEEEEEEAEETEAEEEEAVAAAAAWCLGASDAKALCGSGSGVAGVHARRSAEVAISRPRPSSHGVERLKG